MKFILAAIGAAAGFGVGYATRPSILGTQLPLSLLLSNHPFDAEPKAMLTQHLAVSAGVGLAIGIALVVVLSVIGDRNEG